jgi:hypothetical protein
LLKALAGFSGLNPGMKIDVLNCVYAGGKGERIKATPDTFRQTLIFG